MPNLDVGALQLAVIAFAFLAAGIVKGVVGFGLPPLVLGVIVFALPADRALALVVVPAFIANLWLVRQSHRPLAIAKRFWPLLLTFAITTFIASSLLTLIDRDLLVLILGIIVLGFAASAGMSPHSQLPPRWERPVGVVVGVIAGIMGGLSSSFGPPLVAYLVALKMPKNDYISSTGLIWVVGSTCLVLAYGTIGLLDKRTLILAALALIPLYGGLRIGAMLRNRVNEKVFRRVVLIALSCAGFGLVVKGLQWFAT